MLDPRLSSAAINRRTMLGLVAAASNHRAQQQLPYSHEATAWLRTDDEVRRLTLRWSRLESSAARGMNWFNMREEERAATSFGMQMARIDAALSVLFERRRAEFAAVERMKARDLTGVAGKLAVASRFLLDEDSQAAEMVTTALADLQGLALSRI